MSDGNIYVTVTGARGAPGIGLNPSDLGAALFTAVTQAQAQAILGVLPAGIFPPMSGAQSLSAAGYYVFNGSSAATWTLPPVSGAAPRIQIKNRGSAALTVAAQGSDHLYTNASVTSIVLLPGQSANLLNDATLWDLI